MTDPSGPDNDAEGPFPIDPLDLLRHATAITDTLPGRSATGPARASPSSATTPTPSARATAMPMRRGYGKHGA